MTNPRPVSPEGPAPLNCPFCGDEARVRGHRDYWTVKCRSDGCQTVGPVSIDSAADAVTLWNRRPSRSAGSPETPRKPIGLTCERCGTTTVPADSFTCTAQFPSCEAKPYYADPAPSPGEAGAPTDDKDWQITMLRSALENWGRCFNWCESQTIGAACTCGLARALRPASFMTKEWCVAAAKSEIEPVPAALSGDREDSERLDWLERQIPTASSGGYRLRSWREAADAPRYYLVGDSVIIDGDHFSLREAIDAARSTPAAKATEPTFTIHWAIPRAALATMTGEDVDEGFRQMRRQLNNERQQERELASHQEKP